MMGSCRSDLRSRVAKPKIAHHFALFFILLVVVPTVYAHDITPKGLLSVPVGNMFDISVVGDCVVEATVSVDKPKIVGGEGTKNTEKSPVFVMQALMPGDAKITIIYKGLDPVTCNDTNENEPEKLSVTVFPVLAKSASSANFVSSGSTDEPVNTFTGELFNQYPADIDLSGPLPLAFVRYYASGLAESGLTGSLGDNWRHNFEWTLADFGTSVDILDHQGRSIQFVEDAGNWTLSGQTDVAYQLVSDGANFVLGHPTAHMLYVFNDLGQMIEIQDMAGNTLILSYAGNLLVDIVDGLGRMLTMTHDGNDKLTTVSDGTRTVTFDYSGDDLANVTDARGNVTSYTYDAGGLMTAMTRPEGNAPYTQTYDVDGKVSSQTDADGNTHLFSFNTPDTTMTDPLGNTRMHTHSGSGELTDFQSKDGLSFTMGYDSDGRRDAITDRLGDTTSYTYHTESSKIASITNADGTLTLFHFTARNVSGIDFYDLTGVSYPDSTTEFYGYDAAGNLTARTDRAGNLWTFTYNANGLVETATNPTGGITAYTYNADGTRASSTDPAGNTTTYDYDGFKRLITITRADSTTRTFSYDNNDNLLTTTNERGNTTTYTYNNNNNLASLTDALTNTTNFSYDGLDRVTSVTDPLSNAATRSYDELERPRIITDRNGNTTILSYDARGRLTSIRDGENKVWSRSYDAESIIASAMDPLGNTTTVSSDSMGRFTSTTSPLSNMTGFSYDAMGRVTHVTNPLGETAMRSYDARGLLSRATLPEGIVATYARNELGQITTITDPNGNAWLRAFDLQGRLISTTDPVGNTTTFAYDNLNRVSQVDLPASTLDLSYDGASIITRMLYSDGTDLNYSYDAINRLISAEGITLAYDANNKLNSSNGIGITRDSAGRIASMMLATGKTMTYGYNNRDLLTQVMDWLGGITTFSYDNAGRLIQTTRPNGVTTSNSYDNDNRLTSITEGDISTIALTRDAKGQITGANRDVPLSATAAGLAGSAHTFDAASQVSGFTYDGLGRLSNDGANGFSWDLASRLSSYMEGGNTVSFTYDALGNRISSTEGGVRHDYVLNYALGLTSISVEQQASSDLRYYIHTPNGTLLYSIEAGDGSRRDYHYDEMGNTLFLTNATGTVDASYAYSPYGELLSSTGNIDNPFSWQGQFGVMQEGDSGLYYLRARYYDSARGRFLSRDPSPDAHPARVNQYEYASQNPLMWVDPTGLTENWPSAIRDRPRIAPKTIIAVGVSLPQRSFGGFGHSTSHSFSFVFSSKLRERLRASIGGIYSLGLPFNKKSIGLAALFAKGSFNKEDPLNDAEKAAIYSATSRAEARAAAKAAAICTAARAAASKVAMMDVPFKPSANDIASAFIWAFSKQKLKVEEIFEGFSDDEIHLAGINARSTASNAASVCSNRDAVKKMPPSSSSDRDSVVDDLQGIVIPN